MAAGRRIRGLTETAGLALGLAGVTGPAPAGPVTIPSAIPLAHDTFTARLQAIHRERVDDRRGGRRAEIEGAVATLGYGFTRDWTGLAIMPHLDKELAVETPGGTVRRQAAGIGDTTLLARYQAWEINEAGATFRVAPLAGVVAPTCPARPCATTASGTWASGSISDWLVQTGT